MRQELRNLWQQCDFLIPQGDDTAFLARSELHQFCANIRVMRSVDHIFVLATSPQQLCLTCCTFIFQSMHSGCENEPIDLEGLHESVVDSDEDLADSMDVSLTFDLFCSNVTVV